jgi:transposase InsO family protein
MPRIGTRKLHCLLQGDFRESGIKLGRDGLFEVLRENHLLQKPKKHYIQTTNSKHMFRKYPNLVREIKVDRTEQVWVSDITYVRTEQGFCYLSMITDAYSRKIVGSAVSSSLSTEVCSRALEEALKSRKSTNKLIHHSDRGIQYCSKEYVGLLERNGIEISMTENGDPYENALAERMNRTIKEEFFGEGKFNDQWILGLVARDSIEIYNQERPHLSLGMKTPNEVHQ